MKRRSLAIGSIIFLALATAVLASSFTLFNNNPTLTGNVDSVLNGSFLFTNTGSDSLTISSIDFLNFQNSKFTFPASAFSNNGGGASVGVATTKTVNYTVSLANNPYAATYSGQINVTAFNSTGSFLNNAASLSVTVLPKKNATSSISTATIVQGQTGQATISVNNIGNTDLSFTSFLPATILNATGWPLTSAITYPASIDVAYGGSNSSNFNITLLAAATPGTYSYNVTISDGSGLNVKAPATLIVQAISENLQSGSTNGQLKVDTQSSSVISQKAIPITITNNGNVDEPVSIVIANLYSTTNSSNVIPSSTLSYNPSSSVTVGKNSVKNINVTTSIGGSIPIGQYRGNLTVLYGFCSGCTAKSINSTVLLDVVQAQAGLSVPSVVVNGNRNTTVSELFDISNTGDFPLNVQSITTNADSKYNVTYSVVGNNFNIPVGGNTTINVTLFIPTTQSSGSVSIGTTTVRTDRVNATGDLAIGTQSSLVFSDMDIKSSESSTHFGLLDQNATAPIKPGSTLTVKPTVLNNFTSTRIKDITVTARINDINHLYDGQDSFLEQETTEFSLNSQSSKSNTFDFTIPMRVEAKNYTIQITAEGTDDTNARQKATWTMSLDLEKSDDSVATQLSMPSGLNCGDPATLKIDLTNTGDNDQDSVSVIVSSDPFKIAQGYLNISLSGDARDDNSVYTTNHDFTIPAGLNATTYPINVETRYAGKTDRNTINVPVSGSKCTGVEELPPAVQPSQGGQTVASIPGSLFFESGKAWYKQPWYLALLVAADALLVIIILWLLIGAMRRRR